MSSTHAQRCADFLALHHHDQPFILANPWDAGTAKVFEAVGYRALATTSSGFAGTLGRLDGRITRDEAIAHSAVIVAAVDVPVSADLENCFADDPAGVAATAQLAVDAGLAGFSIEDFSGDAAEPIYELGEAVERVAAAVEVAHADGPVVVTARAENYLHGRPDLDDTITRLVAFQEAGADVLYAPGLADPDDIKRVVDAVDRPINVLALPGVPDQAALGALGVSRISVGSGFAMAAASITVQVAERTLESGTWDFWGDTTQAGVAQAAWSAEPA